MCWGVVFFLGALYPVYVVLVNVMMLVGVLLVFIVTMVSLYLLCVVAFAGGVVPSSVVLGWPCLLIIISCYCCHCEVWFHGCNCYSATLLPLIEIIRQE